MTVTDRPTRAHPAAIRRRSLLAAGALAGGLGSALAAPDARAGRALLIGVGRVDALPRRLWLEGPGNDVRRMREALVTAGLPAESIAVLADAAEGGAAPTLANVRAALQGLLEQAASGQTIVLHIAGHGSQVPQPLDRPSVEVDGQEEVLLLADVGAWQGNALTGKLPNSLRDTELAGWVDALCRRGARVWVFLDTCHSAGFLRGPTGAADRVGDRVRAVSAQELGVPLADPAFWAQRRRAAGSGSAAAAAGRPAPPPLRGRVWASAAGASQQASERHFDEAGPPGAPGTVHGVFSWHVAALIRERAFLHPTELRAQLHRRYAPRDLERAVPQVVGDGGLAWRWHQA